MAFWEEVSLVLSAVMFFLAGWALPGAMHALETWPVWRLAGAAAGLLAVVLAIQLAASLAATALPSPAGELGTRGRARVTAAGVMAWASTRSVIGLIIALSIPATLPDGRPFAERTLILVVAALAIVGSILVQGLTLRVVVRRAGLGDTDEEHDEERAAEEAMAAAHADAVPDADGKAGRFHAERRALLELRERNRIGDEVLRKMLREADLRQRATEGSALPGGGPPNP